MNEKDFLNKIMDLENIEEDDDAQGMLDFLNEDIPQNLHENIMKSIEKESSKKHFNYKVYMPLIAASLVIVVAIGAYKNTFNQKKSEDTARKPFAMNIAANDIPKEKNETSMGCTLNDKTLKQDANADIKLGSKASSKTNDEKSNTSTEKESTANKNIYISKTEQEDKVDANIDNKFRGVTQKSLVIDAGKFEINYEVKLSKDKNGDILKFIQEMGNIIGKDLYSFDLETYKELEKTFIDNNISKTIINEIKNDKVIIKIINE